MTIAALAAATAMIRVEAIAFGTFAGKDGTIHHFNPDSEEDRYKTPTLPEVDVAEAETRGLAKRLKGKAAEADGYPVDENRTIGTVAAERLEQTAEADASVPQAATPLDSQGTTAWADRAAVAGPVEGTADQSGISAEDPDAPPASAQAPAGEARPKRAAR